jgi:hypothetical protein
MKIISVFITVSVVGFILVACAPATFLVSTKTVAHTQTSTPPPPTPTLTPKTWWILATPLNLSSSNDGQIDSIINQLHPYLCLRENTDNLAILTPSIVYVQIPSLKFTEISALPDPYQAYVNTRADNIDKSRTAFAISEPGAVGNLYVEDNNTGKV